MRPRCLLLPMAFGLIVPRCDSSEGLPSPPAPPPPLLVLQTAPEASVTSVAFSPDGSLVAIDSFDGRARICDARTGTLLRAIDADGGRGVAFSPDGQSLACAGYHMDKLVGVFDVRTGKLAKKLAGHAEIETYAIAFSPDGKRLASAGTDRQVLVWDLASGRLEHRFADRPSPSVALAFSPDGSILASGGGDRMIHLWDMNAGRLQRSLEGHRDWVVALAFSPDGRTIASGSCDWAYHRGRDPSYFEGRDPGCDGQWKLWDAATGVLKRTETERGRLLSLAFAPDGGSLACGAGKDVRVYDLASGAPGWLAASHDSGVTSVAYSPDGRGIVSGGHDQAARRIGLPGGAVEWRMPGHLEQVNSVALSKDASLIATGSSDHRYAVRVLGAGDAAVGPGAVRLWDARTCRLLRRLGDPAEQVMAVALSPDGGRIFAAGGRPDGSGFVRAWDAATGGPIWSAADHAAEVLAIALAPDGASIATAGADGLVKLRDPGTGSVARALGGHEGGATSLAFSPDGAILACGEGHGGTRLWDARSGRPLRACREAGSRAGTIASDRLFTTIAIGPDGGMLLACPASVGNTFGEPVRSWDIRTGAPREEFADQQVRGRPIALSPDGAILATGGKSVKLWDVRTGKPLRELIGHLKKTQSLAFSADGRLLVGGGSYGTTNIWEVASGRHLVTLFAFPEGRGGAGEEEWLACRPEGFYVGSPGIDRRLAWRVGDELLTAEALGARFHRPDLLESALEPRLTGPPRPEPRRGRGAAGMEAPRVPRRGAPSCREIPGCMGSPRRWRWGVP